MGRLLVPTLAVSVALLRSRPCMRTPEAVLSSEIMLIERGHEPGKGLWSVPGGRIEFGETIHQAALRELAEETSLARDQVELLPTELFHQAITPNYHFVIFQRVGLLVAGAPVAGSDAAAIRFASLQEIAAEPQLYTPHLFDSLLLLLHAAFVQPTC